MGDEWLENNFAERDLTVKSADCTVGVHWMQCVCIRSDEVIHVLYLVFRCYFASTIVCSSGLHNIKRMLKSLKAIFWVWKNMVILLVFHVCRKLKSTWWWYGNCRNWHIGCKYIFDIDYFNSMFFPLPWLHSMLTLVSWRVSQYLGQEETHELWNKI